MTNSESSLTGEERLKTRRRSFWRFTTLGFLASAVAGFLIGYASGSFQDGTVPIAVPLALLAFVVVGFIWFTRDYFRRVDELDLMDNLWAHLWGQYFALTVFLVWYFLAELGLATYPSALAVICAMILGTFGVYGLRKLGLR